MNNNLKQVIYKGANTDIDSEERFKQVIVTKLIEALGYDLSNKNEVEIEYKIQIGTVNNKVDYAIENGEDKFALEIKSPKKEIEGDRSFYDQIYSYYKLLNCKYGVLYNGKKLIVFKDSNEPNKVSPVYIWKYAENYPDITIFESLLKDNFPLALEKFLSSAEKLSNLEEYLENNEDTLFDYIISKISEDSKINNIDFVREHTNIKIDYKSNITSTSASRTKDEDNNIEDIEDFHVLRADNIVYKDVKNASEKKWNAPQHHRYDWYDEYVLDVVKKYEPISRKEIVRRVYEKIGTQLYEGDFYKYRKSGLLRWEAMVRWSVTKLKGEGKIVSTGNNDWRIA